MRISDWSSDVCSSDLNDREQPIESLIKAGPLIKMGVENPCLFVNGVISTQRLTNIHLLAIKVILHPKVLIKLQPILLDIILQELIEEWGCRFGRLALTTIDSSDRKSTRLNSSH